MKQIGKNQGTPLKIKVINYILYITDRVLIILRNCKCETYIDPRIVFEEHSYAFANCTKFYKFYKNQLID